MEGIYEVTCGTKSIGKVQVIRLGLYYRFLCRCILSGTEVYKLVVRCGNICENIGVVIPLEDGLFLDKKIPVKNFKEGKPMFYIVPRHDAVNGKFVPICPEEPFSYIERLKDTFLEIKNGQAGVILKENTEFEYDLL